MRIQQGLNSVWSWLGEDRRIIEILALLLILNALCLVIPQSSFPVNDSVAQVRWLAQTATEWKGPLRGLATVHLTHIRTSLWMRLPLACLGLLLAVRVDELRVARETLQKSTRLKSLLFSMASVFIITGWGLYLLLGWTVPALTVWPNTPTPITEQALQVPACSKSICMWQGKMNLYLLQAGESIGIETQAQDVNGNAVDLIPATKDEAQQRLQITLENSGAETFFLVREGERIVRLNQSTTGDGQLAVLLQAFDAQSGALLAEETLVVNTSATILADPVEIKVAVQSLSQYDAVYNPGALVEILGYIVLICSVLLRDRTEHVSLNEDEK